MQTKAKAVINNLVKIQESCKSEPRVDIIAIQPSSGRDVRSDYRVAHEPLIAWDQTREDALK